jgi:hypothetical protein
LDPELAAVVERARHRAQAAGELRPPRLTTPASTLPQETRHIVREWVRDEGYDDAVALVVSQDPELAIQ